MNPTSPLVVSHVEYYGTISASATTFTLQKTITTNPGLNTSFPWLSQIATNYDKYKFRNLYMEYIPSCPTTTSGTIYFAFDPNALDLGPVETGDMLQYKVNIQGSPFLVHKMVVPGEILNTKLYTRTVAQALPSNVDYKTYDLGLFYVVTDATAASGSLGSIKIGYTCEFFDAQPRSDAYVGGTLVCTGVSGTCFATTNLNTVPTIMNVATGNDNTLVFNAVGTYKVLGLNANGTTITNTAVSGGVSQLDDALADASGSSGGRWDFQATYPGSATFSTNGNTQWIITKTA